MYICILYILIDIYIYIYIPLSLSLSSVYRVSAHACNIGLQSPPVSPGWTRSRSRMAPVAAEAWGRFRSYLEVMGSYKWSYKSPKIGYNL